MVMKSLRMLVLIVAVGAWSPFLMQAHAQQEVDPDHFDQPAAAQDAKAQTNHHATAASHQAPKQANRQEVEPPSGPSLTKGVCGQADYLPHIWPCMSKAPHALRLL